MHCQSMAHQRVMRDSDGKVPHLHLTEGDIARYVLLPGPPERARITASLFDEAEEEERENNPDDEEDGSDEHSKGQSGTDSDDGSEDDSKKSK